MTTWWYPSRPGPPPGCDARRVIVLPPSPLPVDAPEDVELRLIMPQLYERPILDVEVALQLGLDGRGPQEPLFPGGPVHGVRTCTKTFIAYDSRQLDKLPIDLRARFPVVLTRKYACDRSVLALMRSCTLDNSPTAVCNDVNELHSEE